MQTNTLVLSTLLYSVVMAVIFMIKTKKLSSTKKLRNKFLFSGFVPISTISLTLFVFHVIGASTTYQINVFDSIRSSAWSAWVAMWPLLLLICLVSTLGNFIWSLHGLNKKDLLGISVPGLLSSIQSVVALLGVFSYTPTA